MIKRTLYFGNPAYLSMENGQLLIELPEVEKNKDLPDLYIVKDVNPSRNEIVSQQIYKAKEISISEDDAKSLFEINSKSRISEEIKYGDTKMWQRCIKVFTDKLGKKIVPFWEFNNGTWNKDRAKELDLI